MSGLYIAIGWDVIKHYKQYKLFGNLRIMLYISRIKLEIMKKEKLYFRDIDSTHCEPLVGLICEAEYDGLEKITLVEAIPDDGTSEFIWCVQHGECVERHDCKKALCSYYESKSGRGVCSNRGQLYFHGNEVVFDVPTNNK